MKMVRSGLADVGAFFPDRIAELDSLDSTRIRMQGANENDAAQIGMPGLLYLMPGKRLMLPSPPHRRFANSFASLLMSLK